MPPLSEKLKNVKMPQQPVGPVWKGPMEEGISFSLLSRFLVCRERFRCLVIDGVKIKDAFNHRLEYGHLWHMAEEVYGQGGDWQKAILDYAKKLVQKYRSSQEEISQWYEVCKLQFPIYLGFWEKKQKEQRTPQVREVLSREKVFCVSYTLPSGRVVKLKGKRDGLDLVNGRQTWLYENKTKGDIYEEKIVRQMKRDLQTMFYAIATIEEEGPALKSRPFSGVLYNCVRRPLSGGKGTIRRHKATKNQPEESKEDFYRRLAEYIVAEPETYFYRWDVTVTQADINRFKKETFNPILESLCDWWEWIMSGKLWGGPHFTFPYGTYSSIIEGVSGELDEYLATGSEVGLCRTTNLFPELEESVK